MFKIIKKLPLLATIASIAFLLVQVGADLYTPTLVARIINGGVIGGDIPYIWYVGGIMMFLTLLSFTAALLNTYISAKIAYRLGSDLRGDIYRKVECFSKDELDKIGTASLITRNTNDVTQVQNLIEMGLKFLIMAPLNLVGGIILAYRLSPSLSVVFFAVLPFIALIAVGISLYANPLFSRLQDKIDQLNLIFREGLNGVKVIRAFNREHYEFDRYEKTNREYTSTAIRVNTTLGLLMPGMTMIMGLATVAITWLGARGVQAGTVEVGTIIGIIGYSTQIMMGFMILTNVIAFIPRGQTSARRINEVLDMPITVHSPDIPKALPVPVESVQLDSVCYRYPGAERDALENLTLEVERGQTLAIIGGTGSGKTTLINLISRLYDVCEGSVRLSGIDVREVSLENLHSEISLVPQKSTLFHGTVRDNIKMGNPEATDAEVWQALETANATEFIQTLDNGLDSIVEKNGGNFSGGQRQRLCIARALIKKAGIYIFDDSFSALDFKTDAYIRHAMKPELKNAVTIIVAQRISTVMDADIIAVLNEGKLAGFGTHGELKEVNEVYKEIIQSQLERETAA